MAEERQGFLGRLRERLGKARTSVINGVKRVFAAHGALGDSFFDELEGVLIEADFGVDTALGIVETMRQEACSRRVERAEDLLDILKEDLVTLLSAGDHSLSWDGADGPHVTLIAGVNGSGKTTTAGKLASHLKGQGKTVMLGAADTFRAAAVEQLTIWSERAGVPIVKHQDGADPAAVAFDAADAAQARRIDCLLLDTAGRLHTKVNLMEELKKIQRVVGKRIPGAPHEVLLVLDATTGQNGLQQARIFTEALQVTGLVLTKLDGTAKGGIVVSIQKELGVPIKLIGVGEGVDDLQPFNAREFVEALFS
ncbi:MAG TPA: signal recognition particle-docking protein FtsY [Candidatus Hydrogenedentes bacterium]|jgi:fused signal recognition particle receptor|nr:signal recognition particle-docking protein FtsY [Candidatus Hydrogenedentota bacterium]HPK00166.1 signal recognition particle-docking protein FtsY [Candidatus Hydrogenedentota bacterium]